MNEWRPRIVYSIEYIGYLLYLYRDTPKGKEFLLPNGKTEIANGSNSGQKWLARFDSPEQLRELIAEAERQGVKSMSTDRVEGELTATKHHLEDMRKIVFTPKGEQE